MKVGIIDIGSNSIKMNIYQCDEFEYNLLVGKSEMLGLMNYITNHRLDGMGIFELTRVLSKYQSIINDLEVDQVYYFAAASFRNIDNAMKVVSRIKSELNIDIDVISEEQEGYFDYLGVLENYTKGKGTIIDIGGGSNEVVLFKNNQIIYNKSFNVGSLSLYREYVKAIFPTEKEIINMKKAVEDIIPKIDYLSNKSGVGIGGSIRAIDIVLQKTVLSDPKIITYKQIDKLLELIIEKPKKYSRLILTIKPERIHTIVPGLIILQTIMKKTNIKTLYVSTNGVREGYLKDKLENNLKTA